MRTVNILDSRLFLLFLWGFYLVITITAGAVWCLVAITIYACLQVKKSLWDGRDDVFCDYIVCLD